ncbi:DUF4376 domain-containing protein, partial [Alkalilacustris brevis]|uniref:DUF4376 domain-containing protein n=1 Tax=Alkalilacustris brevis TaxID=2026338 RepID=UPI0012D2F974
MKMAVIDPDTGLVENVVLADPGFALPGKLLVASNTAVPGNLHDPVSGTFHAPAPPPLALEAMKARQRAALAAQRYAVETAGIRLGPIAIATDRVSQQMITAAVVAAGRDAGFSTRWKAADGSFHAIDAETMLAIGTA